MRGFVGLYKNILWIYTSEYSFVLILRQGRMMINLGVRFFKHNKFE